MPECHGRKDGEDWWSRGVENPGVACVRLGCAGPTESVHLITADVPKVCYFKSTHAGVTSRAHQKTSELEGADFTGLQNVAAFARVLRIHSMKSLVQVGRDDDRTLDALS